MLAPMRFVMFIVSQAVLSIALAIFALCPRLAFAFKPKGHEALECLAYRKARDKGEVKWLESKDVVRLGAKGYLPSSGGPDHSLERQFDTENQAFHFMARNQTILDAIKTADPSRATLEIELPRIAGLMRLLMNEIAENSAGARQTGRGFPVLLHIVGDSFSREHTRRDKAGKLIAIKGWKLLRAAWPAAATAAEAERAQNGQVVHELLHHARSEGADVDWHKRGSSLRTGAQCGNSAVVLQDDELTAEAALAVNAMVDLMSLANECADGHCSAAVLDSQWDKFWKKHFSSDINIDTTFAADLYDFDRFPRHHIGLGTGWTISDKPHLAAALEYQFHAVPLTADSLWSRLMPSVLIGSSYGLGLGIEEWDMGLLGAISTRLPYVRWVSIGAGGSYTYAKMDRVVKDGFAPRWRITFGDYGDAGTLSAFIQGTHPLPMDRSRQVMGECMLGIKFGWTTWHARVIR